MNPFDSDEHFSSHTVRRNLRIAYWTAPVSCFLTSVVGVVLTFAFDAPLSTRVFSFVGAVFFFYLFLDSAKELRKLKREVKEKMVTKIMES